jgi:hypothetical protein
MANPVFSPTYSCKSPLTCQGYSLGIVNLLAFMYTPYAVINLGYDLTSVFAVAAGISEAKYWPHLFGPFSEAYTIRRFWG